MEYILYSLIIFVVVFFIQLLLISFLNISKKDTNIHEKQKKNIIMVIEILIALLISIIIGIMSFYGIVILNLIGLRAGH